MAKSQHREERQYGHGNHWEPILQSLDEIPDMLVKAHNKESDTGKMLVNNDFIGIISFNPPVRMISILKVDRKENKNYLWSAYPFIQINNPIDITIESIDNWGNGIEAVINGRINNEIPVSFFDTLYFLNKEKYEMGKTYTFNIAALAYQFIKRPKEIMKFTVDKGPEKGRTINTEGMTSYYFDEPYTEDFIFGNPFYKFEESYNFENTGIRKFNYHLNQEDGVNKYMEFPIFVSDKVLGKYEPNKGDQINGSGWLVGYLANSL